MHPAECRADGSGRAARPRLAAHRGWSLLEVMAVVVLSGVMATIALPQLQTLVVKSRRSDAWAALGALERAQERHRTEQGRYAASIDELGLRSVSPAGHYDLIVAFSDMAGYRVLGVARDDSPQVADADCACLALERRAAEVHHLSGPTPQALAPDLQRSCWPR